VDKSGISVPLERRCGAREQEVKATGKLESDLVRALWRLISAGVAVLKRAWSWRQKL
jgi:hypothetical protein